MKLRPLVAVLVLALPLVACDGLGFSKATDSAEIPTLEEAEAEAAEQIDAANADEILKELEEEIAADESGG